MPRHLAFPITVAADGALASLEQDSPAEVTQCVALLVSTEPGERAHEPEYGYPSPLGRGVDPAELARVIADHEDRADPALVEVTIAALDEQRGVVHPGPATASTITTDGEG